MPHYAQILVARLFFLLALRLVIPKAFVPMPTNTSEKCSEDPSESLPLEDQVVEQKALRHKGHGFKSNIYKLLPSLLISVQKVFLLCNYKPRFKF